MRESIFSGAYNSLHMQASPPRMRAACSGRQARRGAGQGIDLVVLGGREREVKVIAI